MIVDVLRKASVLEIYRVRKLPLPGMVRVITGESVTAEDVIAQASIPSHVLEIDVATALGVAASDVSLCMMRDVGEELDEGDVIAQSIGAIPRVVRAPVAGRLVAFHQGKVTLATGEYLIRCQAGMNGKVLDVIPEYGAILTARGTLLQGVWGNGKVGSGVLSLVEDSLDRPLEGDMLENLESGAVLAVGFCQDKKSLDNLVAKEVKGLVLGSLSPDLLQYVKALPIPVIVLQGFGLLPPDPISFDLLRTRIGVIASLNAGLPDILNGNRPEVVLLHEEDKPEEDLGFRSSVLPGQRVQVNSGDHYGQTGVVLDIPNLPTKFESGVVALPAVIRLENGEIITVPGQNLFILG